MSRFYLIFFFVFLLFVHPSYAKENMAFSGSWIANGSRTVFAKAGSLELYNYELRGHVNLDGNGVAGETDFWGQCTGVGTSREDALGRCLWVDLDGDSLLLNLETVDLDIGRQVLGVILRGTGVYEKITGEIRFTWSSMFHGEEEGVMQINGAANNLRGLYVLPKN